MVEYVTKKELSTTFRTNTILSKIIIVQARFEILTENNFSSLIKMSFINFILSKRKSLTKEFTFQSVISSKHTR